MRERVGSEVLALVVAALVCAAVSNMLAGPERRLAWVARYAPEKAGAVPEASRTPSPAPAPAAATGSAGQKTFPPHPDKPYLEISGEDASGLFDRGTVFFDARRSSVYREGHIAGARPMPVWEADIDTRVAALVAEGLQPSAPIVVYCSGGECEDSHMLGEKLYKAGFDNVLVYKDGFPDWEKRGLAVRRGETP